MILLATMAILQCILWQKKVISEPVVFFLEKQTVAICLLLYSFGHVLTVTALLLHITVTERAATLPARAGKTLTIQDEDEIR